MVPSAAVHWNLNQKGWLLSDPGLTSGMSRTRAHHLAERTAFCVAGVGPVRMVACLLRTVAAAPRELMVPLGLLFLLHEHEGMCLSARD